jgi:hypothetical protein
VRHTHGIAGIAAGLAGAVAVSRALSALPSAQAQRDLRGGRDPDRDYSPPATFRAGLPGSIGALRDE